jgi:hypothetical protein
MPILTNAKREALKGLALKQTHRHPQVVAAKAAADKAHAEAKRLARQHMDKVFPPKDMAILRKYGCTLTRSVFGDSTSSIAMGEDIEVPHMQGSFRFKPWPEKAAAAIFAWRQAASAHRKAITEAAMPFLDLMQAARTTGQVLAEWPEAAEILGHPSIDAGLKAALAKARKEIPPVPASDTKRSAARKGGRT